MSVTHVHEWRPNGTATEDEVAYSPVSVLDHRVRTITYAVQSCSCGKVVRQAVGVGQWRPLA